MQDNKQLLHNLLNGIPRMPFKPQIQSSYFMGFQRPQMFNEQSYCNENNKLNIQDRIIAENETQLYNAQRKAKFSSNSYNKFGIQPQMSSGQQQTTFQYCSPIIQKPSPSQFTSNHQLYKPMMNDLSSNQYSISARMHVPYQSQQIQPQNTIKRSLFSKQNSVEGQQQIQNNAYLQSILSPTYYNNQIQLNTDKGPNIYYTPINKSHSQSIDQSFLPKIQQGSQEKINLNQSSDLKTFLNFHQQVDFFDSLKIHNNYELLTEYYDLDKKINDELIAKANDRKLEYMVAKLNRTNEYITNIFTNNIKKMTDARKEIDEYDLSKRFIAQVRTGSRHQSNASPLRSSRRQNSQRKQSLKQKQGQKRTPNSPKRKGGKTPSKSRSGSRKSTVTATVISRSGSKKPTITGRRKSSKSPTLIKKQQQGSQKSDKVSSSSKKSSPLRNLIVKDQAPNLLSTQPIQAPSRRLSQQSMALAPILKNSKNNSRMNSRRQSINQTSPKATLQQKLNEIQQLQLAESQSKRSNESNSKKPHKSSSKGSSHHAPKLKTKVHKRSMVNKYDIKEGRIVNKKLRMLRAYVWTILYPLLLRRELHKKAQQAKQLANINITNKLDKVLSFSKQYLLSVVQSPLTNLLKSSKNLNIVKNLKGCGDFAPRAAQWMQIIKEFLDAVNANTKQYNFNPEMLFFLALISQDKCVIPDDILFKFEVDRLTFNAFGGLKLQNTESDMILGEFIIIRTLIYRIILKFDEIPELNVKSSQTNRRNAQIFASILYNLAMEQLRNNLVVKNNQEHLAQMQKVSPLPTLQANLEKLEEQKGQTSEEIVFDDIIQGMYPKSSMDCLFKAQKVWVQQMTASIQFWIYQIKQKVEAYYKTNKVKLV